MDSIDFDIQQSLQDAPIAVFIIDSHWTIKYVNSQALAATPGENNTGKDFREVMQQNYSAKSAEFILAKFQTTLATGESFSLEEFSDERLGATNREYYDAQIQRIKLSDGTYGIICYFQNVTRPVLLRLEAEHARREFEQLADAMPQMVWTATADGALEFTNHWVHDYGGVSRNVIIGWSFIDGFHPDDKEMARQVWTDCIKTGTPYELEARLRDKDGNYRWFIIRGLPGRDESGQIVKWFGTNTDIHDKKIAEERLEQLVRDRTKQLEVALFEAQKAHQLKSQFVSTISHEVRTPLAGVIGLTEFLTTLELLPEVREIVDHIGQASSNLFSILNNLVEFSRLEAEKGEIDYVVFEPRHIVSEIEASFEAELVRKKLPLRVEIADDVPIKIYGDERKTVQILSHLLSNAIKFTRAGNVTIQASLLEINNTSSKRIRFSVIDTGVGLTKEAQERIFHPFAQGAGPQMTPPDGMGVGLSVCKHYVDVLGGEIGFTSELGKGSTFWFNLPFLNESAEACQKNEES